MGIPDTGYSAVVLLNQAFDLSLKPIDCVAPVKKIQLILGSEQ
jgi:hypothetical protein